MSATSTPNDSPSAAPIQPLHNPEQAAHVVVPQAPLGSVANQAPGMGAKAILAKKMAKSHNPNYISPTDNMMTPVTKKLAATKNRHFAKTKPVQLFAQKEEDHSCDDEQENDSSIQTQSNSEIMATDDQNPF